MASSQPTLGRRAHGAGNKIRYSINCADFLEDVNASLTETNLTVQLDPDNDPVPADAVISDVDTTPSGQITFFLAGGVVNEVFTVLVQFTDTRGEVKNDSIEFHIIAS